MENAEAEEIKGKVHAQEILELKELFDEKKSKYTIDLFEDLVKWKHE